MIVFCYPKTSIALGFSGRSWGGSEASWGGLGASWGNLGGLLVSPYSPGGLVTTPPLPPSTQIYRFSKSSETSAGVAPERFFERPEPTLLSLKQLKATQGDLRWPKMALGGGELPHWAVLGQSWSGLGPPWGAS